MYQDIGNRIKSMRKHCGMTREKLAEHVDLSVSYIGLIERGYRKPGLSKLMEICKVLNTPLEYIVYGTGKMLQLELIPELKEECSENFKVQLDNDQGMRKKYDFLKAIESTIMQRDLDDNIYKFFLSVMHDLIEVYKNK